MKKLITLSILLISLIGFSQKHNDELAVVKVKAKITEPLLIKHDVEIKVIPTLTIKASVQKGFQTGNSGLISVHFSANVDVSFLDKENLYSKSQAEQVLKTFFTEHNPTKFSFIHEGKSSSTKYYIGTLETSNGDFRITVNTKITSGKEHISHLTIEED